MPAVAGIVAAGVRFAPLLLRGAGRANSAIRKGIDDSINFLKNLRHKPDDVAKAVDKTYKKQVDDFAETLAKGNPKAKQVIARNLNLFANDLFRAQEGHEMVKRKIGKDQSLMPYTQMPHVIMVLAFLRAFSEVVEFLGQLKGALSPTAAASGLDRRHKAILMGAINRAEKETGIRMPHDLKDNLLKVGGLMLAVGGGSYIWDYLSKKGLPENFINSVRNHFEVMGGGIDKEIAQVAQKTWHEPFTEVSRELNLMEKGVAPAAPAPAAPEFPAPQNPGP